jgi:hypothetical protein
MTFLGAGAVTAGLTAAYDSDGSKEKAVHKARAILFISVHFKREKTHCKA